MVKVSIILVSTFLIVSSISQAKNFWNTKCSTKAIDKEFDIKDADPLMSSSNNRVFDSSLLEVINGGKRFKYYLIPKIGAKTIVHIVGSDHPSYDNTGFKKIVCVNGKVAYYEMAFPGTKSDLLKALKKYGKIVRTVKDGDKNFEMRFHLFQMQNVSYVVMIESIDRAYKSKPNYEYKYRVAYFNSAIFKKLKRKYHSILSRNKSRKIAEKKRATKKALKSLK